MPFGGMGCGWVCSFCAADCAPVGASISGHWPRNQYHGRVVNINVRNLVIVTYLLLTPLAQVSLTVLAVAVIGQRIGRRKKQNALRCRLIGSKQRTRPSRQPLQTTNKNKIEA